VKIVGAKNPATGEPTWTVQAQISDELAQKRSELLSLVEAVKSKFREFDTEEAKKNNPDLEQPQEEAPEQPETPQNDEEAPKQDETPVEQPEDQPEPAQEPQSDEQPQEPVEEPRQENQEQAPQSN
jgi:outer membrane biosynthesis protein TonB